MDTVTNIVRTLQQNKQPTFKHLAHGWTNDKGKRYDIGGHGHKQGRGIDTQLAQDDESQNEVECNIKNVLEGTVHFLAVLNSCS